MLRYTWLCGSGLVTTVGTVSSHHIRAKGLKLNQPSILKIN